MLSAFLCAGIVAAPLSFAGLAMPVKRRARVAAGWWPAIRRFMLAVAGTAVVAAAVALALGLLGITGHSRDAGNGTFIMTSAADPREFQAMEITVQPPSSNGALQPAIVLIGKAQKL